MDVVFCYPSRVIGGAELLLVKSALYLAGKENYTIYYIDYNDGFGIGQLKGNNKINHIVFEKGNQVIIPEGSLVFTPLSYLPLIENIINNAEKSKYFFWSLSPFNIIYYINLYKHKFFSLGLRKRNEIGRFLSYLSDRGIVRYMEYNNYYWSSTTFHYISQELNFLPIFIDDFEKCKIKSLDFSKKYLSFLWLGRIDNDKYNTIRTFINELEGISKLYKIKLYLVGNGNREIYLRKNCKNSPIEVIFMGKMVGDELKELIINHVDIGLAHGTSALDIAKYGKPVIVEGALEKPYNAGVIKDYVLISETKNYDVTSPGYYKNEEIHLFKDLISEILANYVKYAQKDQDHVYKYHTISNVGKDLEHALKIADNNSNTFTYKNIHDLSTIINKRRVDTHIYYRLVRRILSYF